MAPVVEPGGDGSSIGSSAAPRVDAEARSRFRSIIGALRAASDEHELPGILARSVDFLLSTDVTALVNELIAEETSADGVEAVAALYGFIVTFLEEFVDGAAAVQRRNQRLLSEILAVARTSILEFDSTMLALRSQLDFEFLKYLDAEVAALDETTAAAAHAAAIAAGPEAGAAAAADAAQLRRVLTVVRTRVCAEIDRGVSEDVAVLTRLLGFDDREQMRAALRGALASRPDGAGAALAALAGATLRDVESRASVDYDLRGKLLSILEELPRAAAPIDATAAVVGAEAGVVDAAAAASAQARTSRAAGAVGDGGDDVR